MIQLSRILTGYDHLLARFGIQRRTFRRKIGLIMRRAPFHTAASAQGCGFVVAGGTDLALGPGTNAISVLTTPRRFTSVESFTGVVSKFQWTSRERCCRHVRNRHHYGAERRRNPIYQLYSVIGEPG